MLRDLPHFNYGLMFVQCDFWAWVPWSRSDISPWYFNILTDLIISNDRTVDSAIRTISTPCRIPGLLGNWSLKIKNNGFLEGYIVPHFKKQKIV